MYLANVFPSPILCTYTFFCISQKPPQASIKKTFFVSWMEQYYKIRIQTWKPTQWGLPPSIFRLQSLHTCLTLAAFYTLGCSHTCGNSCKWSLSAAAVWEARQERQIGEEISAPVRRLFNADDRTLSAAAPIVADRSWSQGEDMEVTCSATKVGVGAAFPVCHLHRVEISTCDRALVPVTLASLQLPSSV